MASAICTPPGSGDIGQVGIALSAHGIGYLHAPALGCPKPIRNQYKADGN